MTLPNFLCIGAPKCGTTTLYDALAEHTSIALSGFKEPCFFSQHFSRGANWYAKVYFPQAGGALAVGEFSPDYLSDLQAAARIKDTLGQNVKLLAVVRDPVRRAYSHYQHAVRDGVERRSFGVAMEAEWEFICATSGEVIPETRYIWDGLYAKHLRRYLDFFDKQRFLVLSFETDLLGNPAQTASRIQSFLGIPEAHLNLSAQANAALSLPAPVRWIKRLVNRESAWKRGLKIFFPPLALQRLRNVFNEKTNRLGRGATTKLCLSDIDAMMARYFREDWMDLRSMFPSVDRAS